MGCHDAALAAVVAAAAIDRLQVLLLLQLLILSCQPG
jgi:hypothetical protein